MINIIGGAGFIGTRLACLFRAQGKPFRIIDKNPSSSFPEISALADVRDQQQLMVEITRGPIVNLAAEHRDDVTPISLYDEVNVQGARNVCAVAETKGIETIIFTSSVAVYGFAPVGTDEGGQFAPFNDYGRTKLEAEKIYQSWRERDPKKRSLVIIRPTVVFGERNRGNVYNLLKQIARGSFVMIGSGENIKSMAYVENVAAFIMHCLNLGPGLHIYNYIDKPDFDMNALINTVYVTLGRKWSRLRLPYVVGLAIGFCFDLLAAVSGKKLPVSSIRIKKFCANTMFNTGASRTSFVPPMSLQQGLINTIRYEFIDDNAGKEVFYSE